MTNQPDGSRLTLKAHNQALLDGFEGAIREAKAQSDGDLEGDYYIELGLNPQLKGRQALWWFDRPGPEIVRPFPNEHVAVLRIPRRNEGDVRDVLERHAEDPGCRGYSRPNPLTWVRTVDPVRKIRPDLLTAEPNAVTPCMAVLYSTSPAKAAAADRIAGEFRATGREPVTVHHFVNGVTVVAGLLTKAEMLEVAGRYGVIRAIESNAVIGF